MIVSAFYLLAAAISRLTGLPFADALRRRVLAPVGAFDVRFDPRALRSRIVALSSGTRSYEALMTTWR